MKKHALFLLTLILLSTLVINNEARLVSEANTTNVAESYFTSVPLPFLRDNVMNVQDIDRDFISLKIPLDLKKFEMLEEDGQIAIIYPEAELFTEPEMPMVPLFLKVEKLPLNAEIHDVKVENLTYVREHIDKDPIISPMPLTLGYNITYKPKEISITDYPSNWLEYEVKIGLDPWTLERVKYLVIRFYPIRFIEKREILRATSAILSISYSLSGDNPLSVQESSIDTLIITNRTLYSYALELAKMRNESGLSVKVMLVEDIYKTYLGRDEPEKIRNAINATVNQYGIKYLIIFGDSDVVPTRYAYIPDSAYDDDPEIDGKFVDTDLYYADLQYTWDDNNDGLWGDLKNDRVDGVPDIFVGRIPVSTPEEAQGYLKKLKEYSPDPSWWSKALLIGTDTFMRFTPEGEYLSENISRIIFDNFTIVKLYETGENVTVSNIMEQFSLGYGYINYAGHGDNHLLYITLGQSFTSEQAELLNNAPRYPILFTMACSSGRFGDLDGFGERIVLNPNGGVIAYVGSSRIAWGYIGKFVTQGLAGEMNVRFAKALFSDLRDRLGKVWGEMITGYALANSIHSEELGYGYIQWKILAEYNLLGDPTLSFRASTNTNTTQISGDYASLTLTNTVVNLDNNLNVSDLYIANSIVYLNGYNITINSSLKLVNTSITGEGYIISTGLIEGNSTTIAPTIIASNTNITLYNSTIDLEIDSNTNITAYNSIILARVKSSGSSITPDILDGYFEYKTFSFVNVELYDSYISWELTVSNGSVDLSGNITALKLINSSASVIGDISIVQLVNSSTITASDSRIGILKIYVATSESISFQRTTNFNGTLLGNSFTRTTIVYLSVIALTDLSISDSELLKLYINEGSDVSIFNSTVYDMVIYGNTVVKNSSFFKFEVLGGRNTVNSSKIIHLYVSSGTLVCNYSDIYTLMVDSIGNLDISNVKIFHADFFDRASIAISNSNVYEFVTHDNSVVNFSYGTVLMVTTYDSSKAYFEKADVDYMLRQYDSSEVQLLENSSALIQITLHNEKRTIANLPVGMTEDFTLSEFGWKLTVKDAQIYMWHIVSFNSELTIENMSIYWIMAYYNSKITIRNSLVYVIRATHNSTVIVENVINLVTFASDRARVDISTSEIVLQAAYLEDSSGSIENIIFGEILAMGNATVSINDSYGTDIAVLDKSTMTVRNTTTAFWFYVEDTDLSDKELSFKNGYVDHWTSDELGNKISFSVEIINSLISWRLLFWNSPTNIKDSEIDYLIFVDNAKRINITNVKVTDLTYFYNSTVSFSKLTGANITIAVKSFVSGTDSMFLIFFMWNSTIDMRNSYLVPGVVLERSNAVLRNFMPYRGDFSNGRYLEIDTAELTINLSNTSILGLVFNLFESANLSVINSAFDGIVLMDNAKVDIDDSVIGAVISLDESEVTLKNSKIREVMFAINKWEGTVVIPQDADAVIYYGASTVRIQQSSIYSYSLIVSSSSVILSSQKLSSLEATESKISLANCSINELYATFESKISAQNTVISKLSLTYYSEVKISNSIVKTFLFDSSIEADIRYSSLGISLRFRSAYGLLSGIRAIDNYTGNLTLTLANITLTSVNITHFDIYLSGYSVVVLEDSTIHRLSVSGRSYVTILSSRVESLSVSGESKIVVQQSKIGLDLTFRNVFSGDIKIPTDNIYQATIYVPDYWEMSLYNSEIDFVNISIIGSNRFNLSARVLYFIIFGGSVNLKGSIIGLGTAYFSEIYATDSGIGYMLPYTGTNLYLTNSKFGIVMVFMGREEYIELHPKTINGLFIYEMVGSTILGNNAELMDYSFLTFLNTTLVVNNTETGLVQAMDASYVKLINSTMQQAIYAGTFSVVEVYWYLTVNVRYDFSPADNATVEIYRGSDLIVKETASEGKITVLLPQAKITSEKVYDLGSYKIIVSYRGQSVIKEIYLYKTMQVDMQIISPLLISIIILGIAVVGVYTYQTYKKYSKNAKSKRKEETPYESPFQISN